MTQDQVIQHIQDYPIVPVFYNNDIEVCLNIATSCYKGGVRVFEFTNRGINSFINFKELLLLQKDYPDYIFGIGTILTANDAEAFIDAGAKFVVSPCFISAVHDVCYQNKINYLPGCMTVKEIFEAKQAGCDMVKIFPGEVLGQSFVKAIKAVFPTQKMMVTGGVEPTKESLNSWFSAGTSVVGMGSQLFKKDWMENKNYTAIETQLQQCFAGL